MSYRLVNWFVIDQSEHGFNVLIKVINQEKTVKLILFSQQTMKIISKTVKIILFSQQTVKIIAKTVKIILFSRQAVK